MKLKKNNSETTVYKRAKAKVQILDNYESIKDSYRYLDRADRPGKLNSIEKQVLDLCLQLTAKTGRYVTDYGYFKDKIDRVTETVKRILRANNNIIRWKYEEEYIVNGRNVRDVVVIERTEHTEKLLAEAVQKLKEHRTKMCRGPHKNVKGGSQKCEVLYIDNKEEIEDSPLRAISSISETNEKTDEKIPEIKSASIGLLCCEAANQSPRLKIEKEKKVSAKIIQLSAREEKDIEAERRQRTSDKLEGEQGFTLIAGMFDDFKLLPAPPDVVAQQSIAQAELGQATESNQPDSITLKTEENNMPIPLKPTTCQIWDAIRQEALASLEHEVDCWNLKFDFNELEVTEDIANSEIELKGAKFIISDIRKNYFKTFADSFYKIAPNYTFKFSEVNK